MHNNENILESEKMSIERALWLYGFMALWLYGFMALRRRLKYIFIVLKLRLIQIFRRKRNYFVQINFAEKNYLFSTASGNSLRKGYKAIAVGGNSALLCSDFAYGNVTTSSYLPLWC
jgi:glucan phosphoethanolaminetransferase (alkaline phosphatase superfamily)